MIRIIAPNKFKAKSIIEAAEFDTNYLKTLKISKYATTTIVRGIYENFRMLGEALLLIHGKEAYGQDSHNEMIEELFALNVKTIRPIYVLSNLKDLRHKINYKGYIPTIDEAKDSVSIMSSCFGPILDAIRLEIK